MLKDQNSIAFTADLAVNELNEYSIFNLLILISNLLKDLMNQLIYIHTFIYNIYV